MLLSCGSLLSPRAAQARRRAARPAALGVQLQDGSLLFSFGATTPPPPPPPARPQPPPPPSAAPSVSPPVPLASSAVAAVAPELSSAFQPATPSHPVISAAPPRPYADWLPPHALQCSEPASAPLRVAVLLSGGVDSTFALNACCAAGHAVTAFYLQIWFLEDFRNTWDACPWEEDLEYARAVCEQAGVPLEARCLLRRSALSQPLTLSAFLLSSQVVPLTKEYWERVVGFCVGEIGAGRHHL